MTKHYLSKSKIMAGRQCEKRLWLEMYRSHLIEYGSDVEQRFAAGDNVNEVAHAQYPDGVLVSYDHGAKAAVEETQRLLSEQPGKPIFEATFKAHDVLVRVDILKPCSGGFEIIEVKSSTSVKDHHYADSAVQTWVLESAGIPVKAIYLCHIDRQFVYPGNGDYRGLFHYEDITQEVRELSRAVPQWVERYREMLNSDEPEIEMGDQCTDPYSCPFIDYCRGEETEYPLRYMPRPRGTRQVIDALTAEGIEDIRDIPEDRLSNEKQKWVRRVTIAGEPELRPEAAEVGQYGYPRYYLDFETIHFAVPIWEGTGPYKPLPFQWSCHIELASGDLQHEEHLDTSGNPPMRTCAEALIEAIGKEGPIFAYGSYEKTVLNALIARYPDLAENLHKLKERLVDLLSIVRKTYYHPDMLGSWSIKNVSPAIAPHLGYGSLGDVQDGSAAGTAYLQIINPEADAAERERLTRELLAYCKHDTLGMVELVKYLSK
ncbi:MAG: DUF2779 domain-containing protein [Gemmatimonadetes bacterium]|nr:DUF2779 domain-containing protein [Gemmatimonadota bacterium]MYK53858.1 DUF2779 domain-containing protein [Gemmatimonadota bacterium]